MGMTRVEFRSKVTLHGGPQYNPTEQADLTEDIAHRLVGLGLATIVVAAPTPKAPQYPPKDKMIHRPPEQKGGGGR